MHRSGRASRSWLLGVTRNRLRAQWPLLLAVVAVAVLASTLVTCLGLLVTATEAEGARGSLTAIPAEQTEVSVRLLDLTAPVEQAQAAVSAAVQKALGTSVTVTSRGMALTEFGSFPDDRPVEGAAFLGQLDEVQSHARLISGTWAADTRTATGGLPVAVPESAATALGLAVGSTLTVQLDGSLYEAEVVGVYAAVTDDETYWALDPLRGAGYDPVYPKPGVSFYVPIQALGPLVVAPGALAEGLVPVASLQLTYHPDFSAVAVDDLGPLIQRLTTADADVRITASRVANQLAYNSDIAPVVVGVTSGLVVTRSTVVVVSLLLLVLAVAAMAQAARLFTDARAGERRLMRSRGASAAHLLGLTTIEAVLIGLVTAAASPLLAALAYRVIAAQPAMIAAGMPATVEISVLSIATAAAVSVVFVGVLIAPLLARARGIAEEEQASARPSRASGFMRSGIDLALVVLAALAYWQLVSYHGVLDDSASLSIDPVLAVGPALVLLAGALLCVRLIPPASRLIEWAGSRSNRTILPLASWELGRRPTRAVAAVLLLSLALAVGTFGLTFLSTWRQSQLDQAAVAVGAPVRVAAEPEKATQQALRLPADSDGTPAPVFRRSGLRQLGGDGSGTDGVPVQVLGLSEAARVLLDRGRVGEVGGSRIDLLMSTPESDSVGVALPDGARAIDATTRVGGDSGALDGTTASLRGIIENADGLLTTADFGPVAVDGQAYAVSATLPGGDGLRLVGFQVAFDGDFVSGTEFGMEAATIDIGQLSSAGAALAGPPVDGWFATTADPLGQQPVASDPPSGWQLRLDVEVASGRSSAFSLVGWKPLPAIAALTTGGFAEHNYLESGELISMVTQDAEVPLQLTSSAPLIPGAATKQQLDAIGYGLSAGTATASTIVVDQQSLARALAQAGVAGPMVDEWWLDVAPGAGQAYVSRHPVPDGAVPIYSSEVLGAQLQQAPLRVATQAALWVSIAAGALLAAVGFALHSAAALRARRIELAQLRAIGLTRRALVALVGVESLLLCVLGIVFGVSIGLLLATLVGPLVAISPDGSEPVPSVVMEVPVTAIGLLALGMVAVLALVVFVVAQVQRSTQPADLLRGGAQP